MKKPAPKGHTAKHGASTKHAGASAKHNPKHPAKKPARTATHHVTTVAKKPGHAKPRQLTLGDISVCSAEAVAASLRYSLGAFVHSGDVMELYWRTAADPCSGAPILDALKAAREYGIAGHRPYWFDSVSLDTPGPVILGAEMPGSHAMLATPEGWWSWGSLIDQAGWPDALIEESWIVRWAPCQ